MNPVHTFTHYSYFFKIPLLSSDLLLGLPNGVFPSGFPSKMLYAFPVSPMLASGGFN